MTNDLDIDCVCELIVRDYTPWQKRIVRIFSEYIQPEIRKLSL